MYIYITRGTYTGDTVMAERYDKSDFCPHSLHIIHSQKKVYFAIMESNFFFLSHLAHKCNDEIMVRIPTTGAPDSLITEN